MATLLTRGNLWKVKGLEMIKGIARGGSKEYFGYDDTLQVPIIENTRREEDLKDRMAEVRMLTPRNNFSIRHLLYSILTFF